MVALLVIKMLPTGNILAELLLNPNSDIHLPVDFIYLPLEVISVGVAHSISALAQYSFILVSGVPPLITSTISLNSLTSQSSGISSNSVILYPSLT